MPATQPQWSLVLHGGAGTIDRAELTPELETRYRDALREAAGRGGTILASGGSALDAVTATVAYLEDNELFNDTSWFAVSIGQNVVPRSYDPMVDVLSADEVRRRLLQTRAAIRNSANVMPKHIDFIRQHCAAQSLQSY